MSAVLQPVGDIERHLYIGSGDAASIMRVSKWRTRLDTYLAKVEPQKSNLADPDRERIFRRGHKLEPYILEMLVDALRDAGHQVEFVARNERYRHPDHPFLAAEIDGELVVDGVHVNAEAKSVNRRNHDEWGEEGTDQIPIYYAAQVAFAQAVTGRRETWLGAIFGLDDVVMYHIVADDELNGTIVSECVDFWHNHVVPRVPPEPETLVDLARMYRTSGPPPVEATQEVAWAARRLMEIRAERSRLEKDAEQAEFAIGAYMGESDTLLWQGKKILGFKHEPRMLIDGKRQAREQSDIYHQYQRASISRPIRIARNWDGLNVQNPKDQGEPE